MIAPIRFRFDWPPTTNTYWRHALSRGKGPKRVMNYISAEGQAYRQHVAATVIVSGQVRYNGTITEPIPMVAVYCSRPDHRRYDVDNTFKGLGDALTHSRVWDDDSQIQALTIRKRFDKAQPAHVVVVIYPTEPTQTTEHKA